MTRASRGVWVRLRVMLALVAAVLFPMVASAATASAAPVVPFQFDGVAFYQFGDPGDKLPAAPSASPDTGFVRITNNGGSRFAGNIGFNAITGDGTDQSSSYHLTLNPGDHVSISINSESSNSGGFNEPFNGATPQSGAEFFMSGTVSLGPNSQAVTLSIFDMDIHSG